MQIILEYRMWLFLLAYTFYEFLEYKIKVPEPSIFTPFWASIKHMAATLHMLYGKDIVNYRVPIINV